VGSRLEGRRQKEEDNGSDGSVAIVALLSCISIHRIDQESLGEAGERDHLQKASCKILSTFFLKRNRSESDQSRKKSTETHFQLMDQD
jgi:hypothetical protein